MVTVVEMGFKHTEVGIIPEDWSLTPLINVVEYIHGKAHEQDIDENGDFIVANSKFISSSGRIKKLSTKNQCPAKKGDILTVLSDIPNGKALAKCYYVDKDNEITVNQRICIWRSKNADTKFLYYRLNRLPYFLSLNDGVNQTNIGNSDIDKCIISLPPTLEEQKFIATALTDVDELITGLEKLISKKKDIKQGAMQQLLTPPHKGGKRLQGFSEEWIENNFGEISEIYQPTTISQDKFCSDGHPVYGANGIVGYFNEYNHNTWQTIITCRGSTCGTVNKTTGEAWITGNAMVMNVDSNHTINKLFFYYVISNQNFNNCITGSGQPQIVRQPLFDFIINYPKDLDEQQAIAQILSDMDAEITQLETKKEKYKSIKQGMMQELLTGKTRLL